MDRLLEDQPVVAEPAEQLLVLLDGGGDLLCQPGCIPLVPPQLLLAGVVEERQAAAGLFLNLLLEFSRDCGFFLIAGCLEGLRTACCDRPSIARARTRGSAPVRDRPILFRGVDVRMAVILDGPSMDWPAASSTV